MFDIKNPILLLTIFINIRNGVFAITVCEVGPLGKCWRDKQNVYDVGIPRSDADLISTKEETNYTYCKSLCRESLQCFMGAFNSVSLTCKLYRRIKYIGTSQANTALFLWYCCDTNSSYKSPQRCPGFWAMTLRAQSNNLDRSSDPLVEFSGVNEYVCQMKCLENSICGAVNVLKQDISNASLISCQLIIQYPVEDLIFVDDSRWNTFQWQCAHNYSLPDPPKECTPRINHLRGFWVVENTSMVLLNHTRHLIFFYTLDYLQCLHNCGLYGTCTRAWYSPHSYYCLLETDKKESCSQETQSLDYRFTTYVWKNCHDLQNRVGTEDVEDSECRTLIDNTYTYIYPSQCGYPPTNPSHLLKCKRYSTFPCGTVFSFNLHCQSNQSFRSFDILKVAPDIFPNVTWQRVFTGYESFFLVNVSDDNFPLTSKDKCKIFDANMDISNFSPLKIIKRSEWFPPKPTGPEGSYPKHPVKFVIITDTERPFCNCFSIEACSYVMRHIQTFLRPMYPSIPYSFVVTGDGVAYEARGWDHEAENVKTEYKHYPFAIAICGRYRNNPNVKSLSSVKQLIHMAVQLKKVSVNYTFYIYNDIIDHPYPYDGLRNVFELWPHYRGHVRKYCVPIRNRSLITNVVTFCLICLLLAASVNRYIYTLWHKHNCHLVRTCRIESIYSNISVKSKEILPLIVLLNNNYLSLEERHISPYTYLVFWIEDNSTMAVKGTTKMNCFCKSEIFSVLNFCRLQSKLVNVACFLRLPEVCCCSRTLGFVFHRNDDIGKECLLILHFDYETSFYRFVSNLHQNKCVCNDFRLTQYEPRLQHFVTEFNCVDGAMNSGKCATRQTLEEKYTFCKEYNSLLRFY